MISARLSKVLNDLWDNKTRTLLIVLSIAVGLFAVGAITAASSILSTQVGISFAAIQPSSGTVRTLEMFDDDFVRSVRKMEGVQDADARRSLLVRAQTGSGEWVNLTLFAVQDYEQIRVNKIWAQSGAWPPPARQALIERNAMPLLGLQAGDELLVELPNEKQYRLPVAGAAHDLAQLPAQFDSSPYAYISFETLEWFGEPYGYNTLYVIAEHPPRPGMDYKAYAQAMVNRVKNKAEKIGYTIPISLAAEPGQVPTADILQAVILVLGTLGLLSLLVSAFLIVNTISALLAQQKRQIGVMKAIGARTSQVLGMYLGLTLIYGLCALLIAAPLSMLGAQVLSRFMAGMFNFDLNGARFPLQALLLEMVIGLLLPVLASLAPFLANLRISPAEAISAYQGGRSRLGAGMIDRLLSGANLWFARRFPLRSLLLSLRNIFRSQGRLALTLITLTLAGATFIGVISVRSSLDATMDELMRLWNFDILIVLEHPYRWEKVTQIVEAMPGVEQTDAWLQLSVRRVRPDGSEGGTVFMFAPQPSSNLAPGPAIVEGRWLLPEDDQALVVDSLLLKDEPDLRLNDLVILKVNGQEHTFRLVGMSMGMVAPMSYASYRHIAHITGQIDQVDAVLVSSSAHDLESVRRISATLEAELERKGIQVARIDTMAGEREEAQTIFGILVSLLLVMATLLALVGGMGLMGSMSINVLERRREIGVLRAIGASNRSVAQVFIREGVAIGALSWAFSAVLGLPLGQALSQAIGEAVLGSALTFSYSFLGMGLWLGLVVLLSALASLLPARSAARLTVREVLAYE